MLYALVTLIGVTLAQPPNFNFPTLEANLRYTLPVDSCLLNVTVDSFGRYTAGHGSMICRCNEENINTKSSVVCHVYENMDCTGDLVGSAGIYGGCSGYNLYSIENCSIAQETAAQFAENGEQCPYWVASGVATYDLNALIKPLDHCMDYNCEGDNFDSDTRSCKYTCTKDSSNRDVVREQFYSDFNCQEPEDNNNKLDTAYARRVCNTNSDIDTSCGVTVTRYALSSSDDYYCGSKKSPFDTSSTTSKKQYFQIETDSAPIPIGDCYEVRNGYYSYSYKYKCGEMSETDTYQTVQRWTFLGSSSCSGEGYLSENITSQNATISCEGSKSKGTIGYYASCGKDNWDSYYEEYPVLFGYCTPFRMDPDDDSPDGETSQRPWNQNLRVVFSCNKNKNYPSAYFYVNEDCKGDYLFTWDWNYDRYAGNSKCDRPVIKNCGNSKDTVGNKNVY